MHVLLGVIFIIARVFGNVKGIFKKIGKNKEDKIRVKEKHPEA